MDVLLDIKVDYFALVPEIVRYMNTQQRTQRLAGFDAAMKLARLFACFLLSVSRPLGARDLARIPAQFYNAVDQRTGIKVHVRINPFLISPTEVTEQDFESVMGFNPSEYRGANLPVENVSWWDAIRYYNLRSVREHLYPAYDLSTGRRDQNQDGYRLPTEAE